MIRIWPGENVAGAGHHCGRPQRRKFLAHPSNFLASRAASVIRGPSIPLVPRTSSAFAATMIDGPYPSSRLVAIRISRGSRQVGRIVDILIDQSGQVRAAVIDFGGFLGVGARRVVVDWSALHFAPADQRDRITLDLSRDQVSAAPEYKAASPLSRSAGRDRPLFQRCKPISSIAPSAQRRAGRGRAIWRTTGFDIESLNFHQSAICRIAAPQVASPHPERVFFFGPKRGRAYTKCHRIA
jgi:hypothetical protein